MTGQALNFPYFSYLGRWQTQRPLWLFGGFLTAALEIFSVLYFQKHLGLKPCLYCVYIREAMLVIAIGALWAALYPKFFLFRIPGYIVTIGGTLAGLVFSFKLESLNLAVRYWPDLYTPCPARSGFALGRRLAAKWPSHFQPAGECGVDTDWMFLSFNMSELLIIFYIFILVGLLLMLGAGLLRSRES
ncbi:MAG: disulfide bond formation protein B [Deltaproteobacteria bacterium]|jgi:disulfide bond formation protein DsbB|nr:disulfide bond formation protein B [Deltaproteobacteria bacterium]